MNKETNNSINDPSTTDTGRCGEDESKEGEGNKEGEEEASTIGEANEEVKEENIPAEAEEREGKKEDKTNETS